MFDIYLELKLAKKDISVVRIKDMYLGKNEINRTILGVIDEAIEIYTEELAPGTINKYNATRIYVEMLS